MCVCECVRNREIERECEEDKMGRNWMKRGRVEIGRAAANGACWRKDT